MAAGIRASRPIAGAARRLQTPSRPPPDPFLTLARVRHRMFHAKHSPRAVPVRCSDPAARRPAGSCAPRATWPAGKAPATQRGEAECPLRPANRAICGDGVMKPPLPSLIIAVSNCRPLAVLARVHHLAHHKLAMAEIEHPRRFPPAPPASPLIRAPVLGQIAQDHVVIVIFVDSGRPCGRSRMRSARCRGGPLGETFMVPSETRARSVSWSMAGE